MNWYKRASKGIEDIVRNRHDIAYEEKWEREYYEDEYFRQQEEQKKNIDDFFSIKDWKEKQKYKIKSPPQQKNITINLYRGFNYLPPPNPNGTYTLSPQNSEQQSLWFTHDYISRNIDPIEYAQSHGKYFLIYPLEAIKHYQTVSYKPPYDNESPYTIIPEEINNLTNTTENCRFYSGIELPEGWLFSYKTEKFIVSTIPIIITKDMIQ